MRLRKWTVAVAAVTCLGLTATSAQAADGTAYDGTDPAVTGCANSAITIATRAVRTYSGAQVGTLEVRYSRDCKTNWVRMYNTVGGGAVAVKQITRPRQNLAAGGGVPYFTQAERDAVTGWSYGMQAYAPAGVCIYFSGQIMSSSGSMIANTGQAPEYIC